MDSAAAIEQLVTPQLRQALATYSQQGGEDSEADAMLVVVLTDQEADATKGQEADGSYHSSGSSNGSRDNSRGRSGSSSMPPLCCQVMCKAVQVPSPSKAVQVRGTGEQQLSKASTTCTAHDDRTCDE